MAFGGSGLDTVMTDLMGITLAGLLRKTRVSVETMPDDKAPNLKRWAGPLMIVCIAGFCLLGVWMSADYVQMHYGVPDRFAFALALLVLTLLYLPAFIESGKFHVAVNERLDDLEHERASASADND